MFKTGIEKDKRSAARMAPSPDHSSSPTVYSLLTPVRTLQRKCACGGGCPKCQAEQAIQPKLNISQPGDKYEQEADRAADRVMTQGEEETIRAKSRSNQSSPLGANTHSETQVLKGGGSALPHSARAFFEPRFGADFDHVRIHTNSQAAATARNINARAFTTGDNIAFGTGEFSPGTNSGKRLLAHELTHVLQNRAEPAVESVRRIEVDEGSSARAAQLPPVRGMEGDSDYRQLSVKVRPSDTMLSIAEQILSIWTNARREYRATSELEDLQPAAELNAEQLAKALMVFNKDYLRLPAMSNWVEGMRLPLPVHLQEFVSEDRFDAFIRKLIEFDQSFIEPGTRLVDPEAIQSMASEFDPAWSTLLTVAPSSSSVNPAEVARAAATYLEGLEGESPAERSLDLYQRVISNADTALPFLTELFKQTPEHRYHLAVGTASRLSDGQIDTLLAQASGQAIVQLLAEIVEQPPHSLNRGETVIKEQAVNKLGRRFGAFPGEVGAAVAEASRRMGRVDCMGGVCKMIDVIHSPDVSKSVRGESKKGIDNMDLLMEALHQRGRAGPVFTIEYDKKSDTFLPDIEQYVLSQSPAATGGYYFFGLSIHAANHSIVLVVDTTTATDVQIYWLDQLPGYRGFNKSNNVTRRLEAHIRANPADYGFRECKLWKFLPASETLIELE